MASDMLRREAEGENLAREMVAACGVTWAEAQARRSFDKGYKGGLRRTPRVVRARDMAVCALRPEYSYPAIARIIGFRNHTAALLAFRRAQKISLDKVREHGRLEA